MRPGAALFADFACPRLPNRSGRMHAPADHQLHFTPPDSEAPFSASTPDSSEKR